MWSVTEVLGRALRRARRLRPGTAGPAWKRLALPQSGAASGTDPTDTAPAGADHAHTEPVDAVRGGTRPLGAAPPGPDQEGSVIAAGLSAFGLGTGSRIALMGLAPDGDRVVAAAIELLGAEAVSVPDHAHGPRLRLRLRGVRAVLTQSPHVPQIAAVVGDLPHLQHLWSWDAGGRDELHAAAVGRMPAFRD